MMFAMELLGPYSQLEHGADWRWTRDGGRIGCWRRAGGTIAAGTNQIQHNIIGERVLGLPKG